jgi:hypothetical protein
LGNCYFPSTNCRKVRNVPTQGPFAAKSFRRCPRIAFQRVDINLATGMTSAHLPSGSNAMAEIEKPIQQLGEEIEAGERRAFAAGWDGYVIWFDHTQPSPLLPIASTGHPSMASLQSASSSGVVGCLNT